MCQRCGSHGVDLNRRTCVEHERSDIPELRITRIMATAQQYCTFFLDRLLFGIRSQEIQEVIPYRELRPVPLAPDVVVGLLNLRGQVLVAVDLRRKLELPERPVDMRPVGLVVRFGGETLCLLADEVGGVVEVEEVMSELLPVPETLAVGSRRLLEGVLRLENELMHVLDTEQICEVEGSQ
jgi:purine-binding chemotaxis protein CheW